MSLSCSPETYCVSKWAGKYPCLDGDFDYLPTHFKFQGPNARKTELVVPVAMRYAAVIRAKCYLETIMVNRDTFVYQHDFHAAYETARVVFKEALRVYREVQKRNSVVTCGVFPGPKILFERAMQSHAAL